MSIEDDAEELGASEGTVRPSVTFMGENAGFKNTFGMYKIQDDGRISDVQIVFANASSAGSGGDLIPNESTVEIDAQAGDNLGFFILPNGYSANADKSVFDPGTFELRDWGGDVGNVYEDNALRLYRIDEGTGEATLVRSLWNDVTWHLAYDPDSGINLNRDGLDHVRGQLRTDNSVTLGFEDLYNNGDKDYDDVTFKVRLEDSGASINDTGIVDGTDQSEDGWFAGETEVHKGAVTFISETADFKNTIGLYKISEDGGIDDVQIVFANASSLDSGGELLSGESTVPLSLEAGETLGFFILPNGYSANRDKELFEGDTYVLRNAFGEIGNIFRDNDLKLFHVDTISGDETLMRAKYGNSTYHMTHDPVRGVSLNPDGKDHGVGELKPDNQVLIGFEDIERNGDWDFDDVVVRVDLWSSGATVGDQNLIVDGDQSKIGWLFEANDDIFDRTPWMGENDRLDGGNKSDWIDAGPGDDVIYGGKGADSLKGGDGKDTLLGQAGRDELDGGEGDDELNGGGGSDLVIGGAGKNRLFGRNGDDTLEGGSSGDKIWGGGDDDELIGAGGRDSLYGNGGADLVQGDAGNDALLGGGGNDTLTGGAGQDEVVGGAGSDVLSGGTGSDTLSGGAGSDRFIWALDDLDGSTDLIEDLVLTGSDRDAVDLSALSLNGAGESVAQWLARAATEDGDDVVLDLSGGTLVLSGLGPLDANAADLEAALVL